MRRTRLLRIGLVTLVVLLCVYTGAWFYLAATLRTRVDDALTALAGKGVEATCGDLSMSGFPIAIGVECDGPRARRAGTPAALRADAFASRARFLRLGRIVSTVTGPMSARDEAGRTVDADWQTLRASTDLWRRGLERGVLDVDRLEAKVAAPGLDGTLQLDLRRLETSTSRRGRTLALAVSMDGLELSGEAVPDGLPAFELAGAATVQGLGDALSGRYRLNPAMLRGHSGQLKQFTAKLANGASLSLTGPFAVDDEGRISGTFRLQIADVSGWQEVVGKLLPGARDMTANAAGMLQALAGNDGTTSVTLKADHGRLALGIIPVGRLPNL
ncbi:DUF2125 domain-containing protein [Pararhizobium mangrovi]|uniref:DUF2125 domain-containing protein n=1 Tax=Pararhizobium mangrovi TaxID=2590452 RepID=UPI0015E86E27|nr:DUF2125 domain-containing protein [Pararhizobium mangrovi]